METETVTELAELVELLGRGYSEKNHSPQQEQMDHVINKLLARCTSDADVRRILSGLAYADIKMGTSDKLKTLVR